MLTILKETYPVAKKEHVCEFCGEKILPSQKYNRQTNIYDGEIYDFITHQECRRVANELSMYDDCKDEGLDRDSFCEKLDEYVYTNHYNDDMDDISIEWQDLTYYEMVEKILEEIKK